VDGKKNARTIERDKQLAVSLDLYETPAFFLNGRKLTGDRPYDIFKKIIDEELKGAKK
jgi:protein-disulfide isomerase